MSIRNKDKDGFTRFTGDMFGKTLAQKLIPAADRLRNIHTQLGTRAYRVKILRFRWSGGSRGIGREYVHQETEITPTPLVLDLGTLTELLTPVGLNEVGAIQVSQISGRFTEDILLGLDRDGDEPDQDEQVLYEIEFPQPNGNPSVMRRFGIRGAPTYRTTQFQWLVTLEKVDEDRNRLGVPE